jgi:tetratricopeptide (TPR) repeat protein
VKPKSHFQAEARQSRRLGWIACVALAALLGALPASPAATNDFFARGVEFSRAGQFPEAAQAFTKAAQTQPSAGALLDLGLAEWQRGHAGAAILAWEQARWIAPFDPRAEADLKFARQVTQVDEPQLSWFESVSTWLPANAWAWLACGTLWLTVALLVVPRVLRQRKEGWHQWLAALTFGLFLLSLAANFGIASRTHIGFVLKKTASLRLTPTQDGEVVSTVAAGEPVRRERTRGHYVFVRTFSGSGWLDQNEFGLLCPR